MSDQVKSSTLLYLAAIVFIIWGILGMMDAKNYTYAGFSANNNTVYKVDEGSPAADAGFMPGDVILKNGGIDANDSKAFSERDRAEIGETREYVVDRNGEEVTLQMTFAAQQAKDKTLNLLATLMGFLFILLGFYAHTRVKSNLSRAFAVFAVMFGFIFMGGPYVKAGMMSDIVGAVATTVVLLSFAYLAVFMLRYPPESSWVSNDGSRRKLFYPAFIAIVWVWYLNLFQPDFSATLGTMTRLLFGVVILFYFITAVVSLIKKYSNASAEVRSASGLSYMLWAAVLGLLPVTISFAVSTLSPTTSFAADEYMFLTFVFIPLLSTMALLKQAKA
jgi:hypothetical protein